MTSLTDPLDAPTSPDEPALPGESPPHERPPAPPTQEADERRIHLYEAVSTQRDKVLDSFDAQRAAILKAVADQRTAALAPIMAVNTKRAAKERTAPTMTAAMPSPPNVNTASSSSMIGAGGRRQLMIGARQAVAAQIVAALKMLVAAEVRAQLDAVLRAAPEPHATTRSAPGEANPVAGPQDQRTQAEIVVSEVPLPAGPAAAR